MTKILAEFLGSQGTTFQLGLRKLEAASGRPNHDIRLTTAVAQGMQAKLRALGLDPRDTTGEELYAVQAERLKGDEQRLLRTLRSASPDVDDPLAHIALVLTRELGEQRTFAMKTAATRKILKLCPPKKAMKALGYRSVDSMLKQESVASLYAAAWLTEGEAWQKRITAAYGRLKSHDFEVRQLGVEYPSSKRWQALSESVVFRKKQNVLGFKELGAVVLLPLPAKRPALAALATSVLAVHAINTVQAAGTLLKLWQVRADFGSAVQQVARGEMVISSSLSDRDLSWTIVHQYFARMAATGRAHLFEPMVQAEDLIWHRVEALLSRIEPTLEFWQGTHHLAYRYQQEIVSSNLTDAVLSHCNTLPYRLRLKGNFRSSLRTELLLCYLNAEQMEQAILGELHPVLAEETVTA